MIIKLTTGEESIIDDSDYELVMSHSKVWSNTSGYANAWSTILNRPIMIHRLLCPNNNPALSVDHINGNKLDNRRCNLRLLTIRQNCRNRKNYPSKNKGNTNPCVGVYIAKPNTIYIQVSLGFKKGVNKRLSKRGFSSLEEAAREYDRLAKIHHGEFAKLNFPNV